MWRKGENPITLFEGGDSGYGWARAKPGVSGYHWTVNWDCTAEGSSSPSMAPIQITQSLGANKPISAFIEWEDSTGKPYLCLATGSGTTTATLVTLTDGVAAVENQSSTDPYARAVLYRNDVGGGGVDIPVMWLCNGAANDGLFSRLADGTTTNSAHTQKFDGLAVVGGDLWGWTGYKIQKNTTDSDPGVTGSWQTAIPVGTPLYPINEVINLGESPIVCKGDGVYFYLPEKSEFRLMTPAITPHKDNGKGAFTDGRGRVYYPTVDGDLLVLTFGYQDAQKPTKTTTIDRDTPFGTISSLTADMEHVYATLEPGTSAKAASGMGMVIKSDDGGSFTTHTTQLKGSGFGTSYDADWGALSTTSDYIYVGADVPFWGAYFYVSSRRTSATGKLTVEISDGASGWTDISGEHDSCAVFDRDGMICVTEDTTADLYQNGAWGKNTVDSVEKYWLRLKPTSAALTGTLVYHVKLVPYRPPLDPDVFPITGYKMAGAMPSVLVGTWKGEDIVWHDVWTLDSDFIEKMLVARDTHTGLPSFAEIPGSFSRRALFLAGRQQIWAVPIGADGSPQRVPFPKLADYGEAGTAMDEHAIAFSGHDSFSQPRSVKRVRAGTVVDFPGVQTDDDVYFYHWWDSDDSRVYKTQLKGSHAVLPSLEGEGRVLYSAIQFVDGSRDEVAPQLLSVEIPLGAWEYNDDPAYTPPLKEDQSAPISR